MFWRCYVVAYTLLAHCINVPSASMLHLTECFYTPFCLIKRTVEKDGTVNMASSLQQSTARKLYPYYQTVIAVMSCRQHCHVKYHISDPFEHVLSLSVVGYNCRLYPCTCIPSKSTRPITALSRTVQTKTKNKIVLQGLIRRWKPL